MLKRIVLASLLFCGLGAAPSFAQSNVIVNFKSSATGATQVSPTAGLPVNVVAGSASGCAGTTGTPCFVNVQNWGAGGAALGAMANYGTSPGAVLVPGVNAAIPDGSDATLGTKADAAWTSGSGTLIAIAKTIATNTGAVVPAGTNIIGKVGIDQTTTGTTNGVVNAANTYNTVAASQSTQALTGGGGGATGDYLSHCTIIPATTAAGAVTIFDNSTAIYSYAGGGTTALLSLIPFSIPIAAVSVSGAWKVTTGANVSVVCVGKFH